MIKITPFNNSGIGSNSYKREIQDWTDKISDTNNKFKLSMYK